jgi:mono/diheme cytochrome c family protein
MDFGTLYAQLRGCHGADGTLAPPGRSTIRSLSRLVPRERLRQVIAKACAARPSRPRPEAGGTLTMQIDALARGLSNVLARRAVKNVVAPRMAHGRRRR